MPVASRVAMFARSRPARDAQGVVVLVDVEARIYPVARTWRVNVGILPQAETSSMIRPAVRATTHPRHTRSFVITQRRIP